MSLLSSLLNTSYALIAYVDLFLLIIGIVGNILNIIIFISLKTFRQTSSVVHLVVASFVNIGQLFTGLISRIIANTSPIDWTLTSTFYCKFRTYMLHVCAFSSLTCVCLAIIDQYLSTSIHVRWQQLSTIKNAYRLSGIFLLFWIIYLCPHLIYYNLVQGDPSVCAVTNPIYSKYVDNFVVPILWFVLPVCITTVFGFLTYNNIKNISYRTVPLLRRRIDEQLTVMILAQVIMNIIVTLPYVALLVIMSHISFSHDSVTRAALELAQNITICLYFLYPASPFYIYICASERFRRQLRYVLVDMYWKQWRKRQIHVLQRMLHQAQQARSNQT